MTAPDPALAYNRHKAAVSLLLGGCLLLFLLGLTQAHRVVIYTNPAAARQDGRTLLVVETRSGNLLEQEPRFEVYADDGGVRRAARLRGQPVAVVPQGEQLLIFLRRSFAVYDRKLTPLRFGRLPPEPAVTLLDAGRPDAELRLLGATEKGLVAGRLDGERARFDAPPLEIQVERLRRARLARAGGRNWAVWIEQDIPGQQSLLRCAELTAQGRLVPRHQRKLAGAALDVCAAEGWLFLSRRIGNTARVERLAFDGARLGRPHRIQYELPLLMRGPVLGLAATRHGPELRLYLARIGSLDRIATREIEQSDWGASQRIGGLGNPGRIAFAGYLALLCFSSLLLVAGGVTLFRRRPARIKVEPPFRLSAAQPPAPIWLRAAAYAADLLLLLPVVWLLAQRVLGADPGEMLDLLGTQQVTFYLVWQAVLIPYFVLCEHYFQRSAGKALFGLMIVRPDGEPPALGALLVRNLSRIVDSAFLVGLLPMIVTPLKQRFGDIWSDTMVRIAPLPEGEEEEDIDW